MSVQAVPSEYGSLTAYLIVDNAVEAIAFYEKAFGAKEKTRLEMPGGKLGHAEMIIGDRIFMMADEVPDMGLLGPKSRGGTTVTFCVYVENVDEKFAHAIAAGGKEVRPVADQFYGDRSGTLEDPFGHQWTLASHIEDMTDEQMKERFAAMMAQDGPEI